MASGLTLLVVEDDEIHAMNVERAFRRSTAVARVVTARDGVEALDLLRGGEAATDDTLVLLDINMPRMNGIEFLREVRADPALRSLPVVVLTTSDDERDKVDAYELNVAGYLLKPVTRERFLRCMELVETYWTTVELP